MLERGVRPVSINSYLTGVRAYLNWLHREGHLPDQPRVQLLKFEHKVIATFAPEHVQRMIGFKPKGTNQTRVHVATCLMLEIPAFVCGKPWRWPLRMWIWIW